MTAARHQGRDAVLAEVDHELVPFPARPLARACLVIEVKSVQGLLSGQPVSVEL